VSPGDAPDPTREQTPEQPAAPTRVPGIPAEPRRPGMPGSLEPAPGEPRPPIVPPGLDATLVLLRHGESEWVAKGLFQGQGDSPLSPAGRRQAALAAERIARPHRPPVLPTPLGAPSTIVHSPLGRTTETATLLQAAIADTAGFGVDVPRRADAGFLEIGQGEWEGIPGSEISERWGPVLRGWRDDPLTAWAPGGESLPQVDARVRTALSRLLEDLARERPPNATQRSHVLGYAELPSDEPWAVIVGHDGVFKVTVLALLDLPLARFWTLPFALCGISIVELRDGRPRLRLHNSTEHLAALETDASRLADAERGRAGAL
jgi:broad specificity phosphatase PhoE